MLLTPAQKQIASDVHRFRVVNCGRRFGKTTLAVLEMIAKAVYGNNRKICYIAPTYQQARDIAWRDLKNLCTPIAHKINESRLEIEVNTTLGGISTISLRGWESIETLRGQFFDFIVIDEIASMRNFWLNWQEVIRPTLTDRKGHVLFISTPKGFNHFYDLYNTEDEDYKSFHFTTYDNPHLPVDEIDKAKKELPEDRFYQEYMADFRKQEGLVYKEFNRDLHVYEDEPERRIVEKVGGVDFGFTNPCAVLGVSIDDDGHYWVEHEWYKTQRTEDQIADYIKSCGFYQVYPDPENPSAIEVLNRKGINIHEVIKGKGSIESGINTVRSLFKQNRLHIHKSCINLIQELETYSYPEKKPNNNEPELPVKENDHAVDCLRYILSNYRTENYSDIEKYMLAEARRTGLTNFSS
jgi:PBSX family phage terminase large subunit